MGFTEVILKPFAMNLFRKGFSLLPRMFDRLDPIMPKYLANLTPSEIEGRIYSVIEGSSKERNMTLSEREKKALFEEFIKLYNPVIATQRNL
jgi:hypothetical protein